MVSLIQQAELLKVRAYRLVPHTEEGLYNLNGEHIDYGPVQAAILPRCCYVFSTLSSSLPVARRFEEEKYEEALGPAVGEEGADEEVGEGSDERAHGAAVVAVGDDQGTSDDKKQLDAAAVVVGEGHEEGDGGATAQ